MLNTPKTILLTGGTSGIGFALFKQLSAQGHTLIVVARNKNRLSELQKNYPMVIIYGCNLSSRQQIESLTDKIANNHPNLSIVINNAAVQYTPTFIDNCFEFDSIEQETTINFLAPVWISYLLLSTLIDEKKQSAIVNISSGLVFSPKKASAIYCATKAAIHSFSQSLRYQLVGSNVLVYEVIMSLVETPMTDGRASKKMSADEAAQQVIKGIIKNKSEIFIGKAKFLPILMRISPALVRLIMRRY